MGGNQSPPDPAAYSTQMGGNPDAGYHTTGYRKIIIDPRTLDKSIGDFREKLKGQNTNELRQTLLTAMIDSSAFGRIPNAEHAAAELTRFVNEHADAISQMGESLADFVARVQAAAQLGYDADPETQARAAAARAHHWPMAE